MINMKMIKKLKLIVYYFCCFVFFCFLFFFAFFFCLLFFVEVVFDGNLILI